VTVSPYVTLSHTGKLQTKGFYRAEVSQLPKLSQNERVARLKRLLAIKGIRLASSMERATA
jgi:hypothetical protein